MKRILILMLILSVVICSSQVYDIEGDIPFSIKPMFFTGGPNNVILHVYIFIPISSLKFQEKTVQRGTTLYAVVPQYDIRTSVKGKEINKERWKNDNLFSTFTSRLNVIEFYNVAITPGTDFTVDIIVTDTNEKPQKRISHQFKDKTPDFSGFSISSILLATEIRPATPDDPKHLQFNSLYFKPIPGNVFYSPEFPLAYFEVYNLKEDADGFYHYSIEYSIYSKDSDENLFFYFEVKESLDPNFVILTEPAIMDIFTLLPNGDYRFTMELKDTVSDKTLKVEEILHKRN